MMASKKHVLRKFYFILIRYIREIYNLKCPVKLIENYIYCTHPPRMHYSVSDIEMWFPHVGNSNRHSEIKNDIIT